MQPQRQGRYESEKQVQGRAQQADTREQEPTDLHELHHGHWVEEMEPGESVLSGGGVGYARDLQRGSVAGKDCVSVERKMVSTGTSPIFGTVRTTLRRDAQGDCLLPRSAVLTPGGSQRKDTSSYKKLKSNDLVRLILVLY